MSWPRLTLAVVIFGTFLHGVDAIHVANNGDGTYTNLVMPDPSVLRVGSDYYLVTSSIETSPSIQVMHSTDLVNWDVIGSVSHHWPTDNGNGTKLLPNSCWSPRIMHIHNRFRVISSFGGGVAVFEAKHALGPWALLKNSLTGLSFGSSTFVDTDGKTHIPSGNFIQECDAERCLH